VATEYAPAQAVLANLEAFAAAAQGQAAYPVSRAEMVANISIFEAVVRAARSGRVEAVEG
jgi:predicted dehydrogenase